MFKLLSSARDFRLHTLRALVQATAVDGQGCVASACKVGREQDCRITAF